MAALYRAKDEVAYELARVARVPPRFSSDGRIALLALSSQAQVHPLIATRWSRSLKGKNLVAVMAANDGYIPGKVNFAMRKAAQGGGALAAGGEVDLIALLKSAVEGDEELRCELGSDFARGHALATGGSVDASVWPKLLKALGLDGTMSKGGGAGQKRGALAAGALPGESENGKKTKTLLQFGFKRQ